MGAATKPWPDEPDCRPRARRCTPARNSPMSEPKPAPDAAAAWSRLVTAADRVFLASEELDQHGGIGAVAGGWTPARIEKAAASLQSARDALDGQIAALKALKKVRGPRKPTAE